MLNSVILSNWCFKVVPFLSDLTSHRSGEVLRCKMQLMLFRYPDVLSFASLLLYLPKPSIFLFRTFIDRTILSVPYLKRACERTLRIRYFSRKSFLASFIYAWCERALPSNSLSNYPFAYNPHRCLYFPNIPPTELLSTVWILLSQTRRHEVFWNKREVFHRHPKSTRSLPKVFQILPKSTEVHRRFQSWSEVFRRFSKSARRFLKSARRI